jgi:ABC-type Mn2+/Zn2+ transport system ATPase subunit
MPESLMIVCAHHLSVGYGTNVVVAGIDTDLVAGGSVALVGSNGSGKSTLLKTLAGLIPPIEGSAEILGHGVGAKTAEVAYLGQYQQNALSLPLRVVDVVRISRFDQRSRWRKRSRIDDELVDDAMRAMQIEDLSRRPLRDLSGGQRQRVRLAQVLARRARLILLDEPTTGLDAPGRTAYLDAISREKARGAAVVIATHDVSEASTCDRILLLAGRIVADGPPEEVLTPENLLETFGIGLARVGDRLIVTEHVHNH